MSNCDYSACNEILKSRFMNTIIINKKHNFESNLLSWIQKTSYSEYQKARSQGFNLDLEIPVEGIPVPFGLGANTSKQQYEELQSHIKAGRVTKFSQNDMQSLVMKYEDPQIYQTWLNCMTGMMDVCKKEDIINKPDGPDRESKYGLKYEITRAGKDFSISLRYIPYNNEDSYPIVEAFYYPDFFECTVGCLKEGDSIENEHLIILKTIKAGTGIITIDTNKGVIAIPSVQGINREYTPEEEFTFRGKLSDLIYQQAKLQKPQFEGKAGVYTCDKFEINQMVADFTLRITLYYDHEPVENIVSAIIDLNNYEPSDRKLCFPDHDNFCVSEYDVYNVIISNLENPSYP